MNKLEFAINNQTVLVRVYKSSIARKCYDHGLLVMFCPVNMYPLNDNYPCAAWIQKNDDCNNFQKAVNAFEYYNCNHETGYYTAFYIPMCRVDRFSGQRKQWNDTVNTLISYDHDYVTERGIIQ